MQVSARAIGADHHDGADGIARRLQHVDGGRRRRALGGGLPAQHRAGLDQDVFPIAVERRDQLAIGGLGPVGAGPGRPLGILPDVVAGVLEPAEIAGPGGVDALRVGLVAAVEVFDIGGVAAVEEGGEEELFVLVLSAHVFRRGAFPRVPCCRRPRRGAPFRVVADYDGFRLASC